MSEQENIYNADEENGNFISLNRKILQNPIWQIKPYSQGQAWVDLLLKTQWKAGFIVVRGNYVRLERGQCGWSIKKLSDCWGWSRSKVVTFLDLLEKEKQIEQHKNKLTSIISISNFEKYQKKSNRINNILETEYKQSVNRPHQTVTNNKDNNINTVNKENTSSIPDLTRLPEHQHIAKQEKDEEVFLIELINRFNGFAETFPNKIKKQTDFHLIEIAKNNIKSFHSSGNLEITLFLQKISQAGLENFEGKPFDLNFFFAKSGDNFKKLMSDNFKMREVKQRTEQEQLDDAELRKLFVNPRKRPIEVKND
jgi:hypothetical protein